MTYVKKILADFNEWNTGLWVHYSNLSMVKISPKQFHQDPAGIYLFPEKFKTIGGWKTYRYKHFVKLSPGIKILDLAKMDAEDCLSLLEKLGVPVDSEDAERVKNPKHSSSVDSMWELLVQHFMGKPAKFNAALRKAGYDAVFDDTKSIHSAETQLLVLDPTKVKLVKTVDRKMSGFSELKEAMAIMKEICSKYGDVEVVEPKKKFDRYEHQDILEGSLTCKSGDKEAYWKIRAEGSVSDRWTGQKKEGERKSKKPPHSLIRAGLSYSKPRLEYSGGTSLDITNPNWDDFKKEVKRTMDAIWNKDKSE